MHGGWMAASHSTPSAQRVPTSIPTGPIFTTINGFPSFRISSWWLDGGPTLANVVGVRRGTVDRLAGAPVSSELARRSGGATIGARLTRRISSHLEVELSVDYAATEIALLDEALAQAQAAADSFVPAWRGILGKMPAEAGAGTITGTAADGESRPGRRSVRERADAVSKSAAGGAVHLGPLSRFRPA